MGGHKRAPAGASIRREFVLYDEVAIWKQILMQADV